MEDFNYIYQRNLELMQKKIEEYKLTRTLDQLLDNFDRIYVHNDTKTKRIRLMGIEKQYENVTSKTMNSGKKVYDPNEKIPTKRIQLYVLKKRYYEDLDDEEKNNLMLELSLIVTLFKQLKDFREIKLLEEDSISFYQSLNLL